MRPRPLPRPRHRRPFPFAVAAALVATFALRALVPARADAQATPPTPLRVVRVTPANGADAGPLAQVSVSFDRPVAGSLDRSIDPATILRIEPAVRGRLEWRDPVTIRLTPSAPFTADQHYTVTVANSFHAMDGSALAEPYQFSFRARGAVLLTGSPAGPGMRADHLAQNQQFQVVYSSSVNLPVVSGTAYIELGATCGGQGVVRLDAVSQRAIVTDDRYEFREAGGWDRDRALDSMRRVVTLVPKGPIPRACHAELVAPVEVAPAASYGSQRWPFATYGDLTLAKLQCNPSDTPADSTCPTGPLVLTFSNPVRGAEVLAKVKVIPATPFTVRDTAAQATQWTLEAKFTPRMSYAIVADTAIKDVFGQSLRGNPAIGYRTTGFAPTIIHAMGRLLVERVGFRTLAVQHVNIDTLIAQIAPIPDSLTSRFLNQYSLRDDSTWSHLAPWISTQQFPVRAGTPVDHALITGVPLPRPGGLSSLFAIRIAGRGKAGIRPFDTSPTILQVTDLGVHAKVSPTEGTVWVTGVNDGLPKANATVELHDTKGRLIASSRTDVQGLARLTAFRAPSPADTANDTPGEGEGDEATFEGYVTAQLGDDRAVAAINSWDPDLSPWNFNASAEWGDGRLPLAGTVFTERGIYRPTERVYAKAIIRNGLLGALRAPAAGDSIKWIFNNRDDGVLREVTVPLSSFGTSDQSVELPANAPIGSYMVAVKVKRIGQWRTVATAQYQVAEYRPPEFLVDMTSPDSATMPGATYTAKLSARYLFGAPMGRAAVSWEARMTPLSPWDINIPGLEGWSVGETAASWENNEGREFPTTVALDTDTLDARGEGTYKLTVPEPTKGRPARVTLYAGVTDVNRQVVGASTSTLVFPAEFSLATKALGTEYFWRAGTTQRVAVLAVRPNGQRVRDVTIQGTVVRREWHRVRRERNGVSELVGEWVSDTVSHCALTSADSAAVCTVTPKAGGIYSVSFTATDARGHATSASLQRWVAGSDWVPWSDETQFKMDVIPDRTRYSVGDTATVLFASPFTNVEAWIVVEREGVILQRRIRITSGSTTLKFPITEAYAPNAFISILVARGRSAPPGTLDDDGRPTIRVGYAELRVTPEVKRLAVTIEPLQAEYRPGDSARVAVHVRDALNRGVRSEVTLWAVDKGVLALTGYKTPDPLDLIYRERGLGMRLASNLTAVAPQIPEGEKGRREAGGGGGAAGAEVLRSRFKTTAFFLGSVITDASGSATAVAKLPDNLTTFQVMAVAVTATDRFGKGESSVLVTRPLLARQALPRFVRQGDNFTAGAVINRRDGAAVPVTVKADAVGVTLRGDREKKVTLAASRGAEVRFPFSASPGDSASFRFDVTDGTNADAVQVKIPVRPDFHPVAHTIAGALQDTASAVFTLPANIDPRRSQLTLNVGTSPITAIRGMYRWLRVYPYECSEQVISAALPLVALYKLQPQAVNQLLDGNHRPDIDRAVAMLSGRQRADGGIGYWSPTDWTSPWLSAYAGMVLLDARNVGAKVDTLVLSRIATYLTQSLHEPPSTEFTPVAFWNAQRAVQLRNQVAAVDFLSRMGRPDVAVENELLRSAAQLSMEDRGRLAEVLVRRQQLTAARQLMEATWARVRVDGRRAVLDSSASALQFYFASAVAPYARILIATLAVDPNHPLVGPLTEAVLQQGRATSAWYWTTQDYGAAAAALAALEVRRQATGNRSIRVTAGNRTLLESGATQSSDSSIALTGLLTRENGLQSLKLSLSASPGQGSAYYYLTVTEIPATQPVTPEEHGIRVERWYENYATGQPVTSVSEGDLVRVRLRLSVSTQRTFVVLDDALPAGLEAVDLSLRTTASLPGPGSATPEESRDQGEPALPEWGWYGSWDSGWWSPFDHRELRDDRVVYSAVMLWPGTYSASYVARATTAGTFIKAPAHAEEMYNPSVYGRSDGGAFTVTARNP